MPNSIDYVKENVVLNGYSSSLNSKGYCYTDEGRKEEEYISSLFDILTQFVDRIQLISSLNIPISLEKNAHNFSLSEEDMDCRNSLIQDGIISNSFEEVAKDNFHFNEEIDQDTTLKLICYQTVIGGAYGHSFFVDSKNNTIIYPHDDSGLGFILGGDAEKQNQKLALLKEVEQKYSDTMIFKFWDNRD